MLPTVTISGSNFPSPFATGTGLPVVDLVLPGSVSFSNPVTQGLLRVDTSIEEVHESELELTENPVEAGSDITDHSFMRPKRVRLRCGWSNSSLQALGAVISGFFSGGTMASGVSYVDSVFLQLHQIQTSRQLISLTTGLVNYQNMLIRSVRATRDKRTSQALMVEAVCQEAILVHTEASVVPALANQANPANTAAVARLGTQSAAPAAPAQAGSYPPASWVPVVMP